MEDKSWSEAGREWLLEQQKKMEESLADTIGEMRKAEPGRRIWRYTWQEELDVYLDLACGLF